MGRPRQRWMKLVSIEKEEDQDGRRALVEAAKRPNGALTKTIKINWHSIY